VQIRIDILSQNQGVVVTPKLEEQEVVYS